MNNSIIKVKNLKKYFKVYKKEPGLWGSIKSLWKRDYETVKAVDDVSFEIKEGEIIGFIGQNGAGKLRIFVAPIVFSTRKLSIFAGFLLAATDWHAICYYNSSSWIAGSRVIERRNQT